MLQMMILSLKLDAILMFSVQDIPVMQKLCLILSKYARFIRGSSNGARPLSIMFSGGKYRYADAFGLASLQRVFCSSYALRKAVPENPVIVDVGANCGQFTHFSHHYLGASRVISIEPEKESFGLLQLNSARAEDCFPCAISDKQGEVTFYVARESSQLSSYVFEEGCSYKDAYAVPMRRLDDLMQDLGIDHVDLLKIDTEGSEYHVLLSASETLSKTRMVLIEMSIFRKSAANLFKIGSFLEAAGFVMVEFSCPRGGQPRDADALFRRV